MGGFGFIGRRRNALVAAAKDVMANDIAPPTAPARAPEAAALSPEKRQNVILDNEVFLLIARQLGEGNDSIRNLLADAETKMSELDAIKRSVAQLVEPVSKTIRALEEATSELGAAEERIAVLEGECTRLREDLAGSQRKLTELESVRNQQADELAARQAQVAELQSRVVQLSGDVDAARRENNRLSERAALADKRVAQLERETDITRQKLLESEKERNATQKSLDKSLAEMNQVSQRLLDTDKTLTATQLRLQNTERLLTETRTERDRLAAALDEAKQRHQSEIASQRKQFESLQARTKLTEKLLEDLRKSMMERAEEIQSFNRRLAESLRPPAETHPETGRLVAAGESRPAEPAPPQPPLSMQREVPHIEAERRLVEALHRSPRTPDPAGSRPVGGKQGALRGDLFDWIAGKFDR